ncbi:MAG TPA: anthranilate phosphoribosyltransferase, partial [Spirochaetia bacterium]|nr:anthranilate phosphoribosyltransferase [Spirochaetia bacterium]
CNLAGYPAEGVKTAQNIMSSGRALDKLEQYIAFTTSL